MHHRFILNRRTLHHNIFLGQKFADPVNGKKFHEGDEIVFCAKCSKAILFTSWKRLGNRHCKQAKTLKKFPSTFTPKKAAKSSNIAVAKKNGLEVGKALNAQKTDSLMLRAMWIAIAVLLLFVIGFTIKMDRASQPDLRSELSHIEVPKPTSNQSNKNSQPPKITNEEIVTIDNDEIGGNDADSNQVQVVSGGGIEIQERMNEIANTSQKNGQEKSTSRSKTLAFSTRDYEDIDFENLGFSKEELEGLFQSSGVRVEKTIKDKPENSRIDPGESLVPKDDSGRKKQDEQLAKTLQESEVGVEKNMKASSSRGKSKASKVVSETSSIVERSSLKKIPNDPEEIRNSLSPDDDVIGIKKFMELISSSQVDFELKKEYQLEMIQTYFSDKLAEVLIEKNGVVVGSMDIYSLTNKLMTSPSLGVRNFSYQKNEDEKIYQFIVDTSIKRNHTWN